MNKVPNAKTLAMYRRLLKAVGRVFEGDYVMFHRTRIEVRKSIEATACETDPVKINELLF
jgi:hypothetical protein